MRNSSESASLLRKPVQLFLKKSLKQNLLLVTTHLCKPLVQTKGSVPMVGFNILTTVDHGMMKSQENKEQVLTLTLFACLITAPTSSCLFMLI